MAKPQVNPFQTRTENEDLPERLRLRHAVDAGAIELQRQVILQFTRFVLLIEVRPRRGRERRKEGMEDTVLVEVLHCFE